MDRAEQPLALLILNGELQKPQSTHDRLPGATSETAVLPVGSLHVSPAANKLLTEGRSTQLILASVPNPDLSALQASNAVEVCPSCTMVMNVRAPYHQQRVCDDKRNLQTAHATPDGPVSFQVRTTQSCA
eukprot:2238041-Pyramimonas_sp.AAC.1